MLGAKGEKADDDVIKMMESKGVKGVAKLLAKRYIAEHS